MSTCFSGKSQRDQCHDRDSRHDLARRGVPQVPADLAGHDCLAFSDAPGIAEWRFDGTAKTQRKIRISARLWVNSLDALVTAAKQGVGIVRVPSWQVEADIAAGALQRLLRDYERPPVPLHLLHGPSRLSQPKCRVFVDYLVEQWRIASPFGAPRASRSSE